MRNQRLAKASSRMAISAPHDGSVAAGFGVGAAAAVARSAAQPQALDQRLVAIGAGPPYVVEQPPALTHQPQQAAAGVVVLLVLLEVLREIVDPLGQQRDLDLRRAGVG